MSGPFVKVFATAAHHYVYDVNTNALFRADAATAALVEALSAGGDPAAARLALADRFAPQAVAQALQAVADCTAAGYLSAHRPAGLRLDADPQALHAELATGLNQLILGVTQACNLRCRYCVYSGGYDHFRDHAPARMSPATARRALDFFHERARAQGPTSISFYGGEPLLEFALIKECISYYRAKGAGPEVHFSLTTNGTLLTREVRDFLAAHDVILRLSLDGPAAIHDANRVDPKGRGSYALVREHLECLRTEQPDYCRRRLSIAAVAAAPYRPNRVRRFFERDPLFAGLNVRVNGVRPGADDYLERFPVDYRPRELAALRRLFVRQQVAGMAVSPVLKAMFEPGLTALAQRHLGPLPDYPHPNQVCVPGVRRLFVDARGRFQPCERFNETLFIGDLDQGIDEARVRGLIADYIAMSDEDCRDCWALRLCRTCYISANGAGLDLAHKRRHCDLERRSLASALALYCTLMEGDGDCLNHLREQTLS